MSKVSARAIVAALVLALAATGCTAGSSSTPPPVVPKPPPKALFRLVGVGDSLTAGVQSNGLMGQDAQNPVPGSPFPVAFKTQENGFWALLWRQMNGGIDTSDPSVSPLPLIAAPGVGTLLVPNALKQPTPIVAACAPSNLIAYTFQNALATRLNPTVSPFDVGIPGQTLHGAIYQFQPTGPCNAPPGPTGALAPLLSENGYFYPILGTWGGTITQLNAAISLHGSIDTVWLGSNDILKAAFSGGAVGPTSPKQFAVDLATLIQALQKSGARVVVANLVDILGAAFFFPGPTLPQSLAALLENAGVPPPVAVIIADNYAAQVNTLYGIGPSGGYLTLQGIAKVAAAIQNQQPPTGLVPQGDFVTAALAVRLKNANLAYNAAIANVSKANGAPMVDVYSFFVAAEKNGIPINPPICCTVQYGGGFSSLDGLHPSNTGYAEVANLFINTINAAYGLGIRQVDVQAIYRTDPFAPH
jgi:hypothetical protein